MRASLLFLALVALQLRGQVTFNCAGVNISNLRNVIYVSPTGLDSGTCGISVVAARQTIQQGIHNCAGAGCSVLVRYGLYRVTTPVTLANGVSIYGSCFFDNDQIQDRTKPILYRTIVAGPSPVITANQITSPTTMHGFVVNADDTTNPGQASIAMTISNSNALTFRHNVLASGKGGDGVPGVFPADGDAGGNGNYPQGNSGGTGGHACVTNPSPSDGDGGQGADFQQLYSTGCAFICGCSNNNYPNSLGRSGHASGGILGGAGGQRGDPGCGCGSGPARGWDTAGDGGPGQPGNPGPCATQGGVRSPNAIGTFSQNAWMPSSGGAGDSGKVGSGGGGGSSGGYGVDVDIFSGSTDYHGKPGGGGGGGGCGGPGGGGGGQGGASIPLVLIRSTVHGLPSTNVLIPGPGGRGGCGASGANGGPGGFGVTGSFGHDHTPNGHGLCSGTAPGNGGKGGDGGQGGAGSGGAGGNGGPSFGIALVGSSVDFGGSVRIYPANRGAAGSGGAGGQNDSTQCQGARGQDGLAGFANDNNSVVIYQ